MPDVLVDIRPGEKSNGESLTLPSTELIVGGEDDRVYLCEDVNKVTDISRLLSMYTLRTVARSLRRFYGVEEGTTFSQTLQFHNAFHLCPAKGARWDLMAVPGYQEDTIAMILIVVPPWEFDLTEFQNFALEGVPAVGSVEHIPTNTVPNACTILWALLWSICNKWKCRYFAVTTYQHWAFGNISERGYRAQVTDVIEAPVYCAEEQVPKEVLPRPNLAEILTFWMGASLGGAGGIWEVPNDLPKDVFGTVEKPQKPQTGEGTSKATAA
ncbi:hypothetical protein BV22DRAFT_1036456 [Leucogyrophana mollusca]|uniref:Uncharacterized protein n=1 Tax=Leucogyrophana mollusca TaxID=85980 RepID=A0ACB8BET6_9AGAM|nr:hypothetical protein BV22DRAFT_1036456 [Leucogyrophana mollusca]